MGWGRLRCFRPPRQGGSREVGGNSPAGPLGYRFPAGPARGGGPVGLGCPRGPPTAAYMAARFPRFHVGVTPFKGRKCAEKVFQSAYRRGCDLRFRQRRGPDSAVSIHAPAWGATPSVCEGHNLIGGFNPRTRVGCDAAAAPTVLTAGKFQSTHPRGVRRGIAALALRDSIVSIHAPAWGATFGRQIGAKLEKRFQSTHPRGVRQINK